MQVLTGNIVTLLSLWAHSCLNGRLLFTRMVQTDAHRHRSAFLCKWGRGIPCTFLLHSRLTFGFLKRYWGAPGDLFIAKMDGHSLRVKWVLGSMCRFKQNKLFGYNIRMYWTNFWQPTVHVKQNIFERTLIEVCSPHLYLSFGTFYARIG